MKQYIIILFILSVYTLSAQNKQINEGNIRFISEKKGFSADNNSFKSEINVKEKTITFTVSIVDFSFLKPKMEKHFNNKGVMNSKKYPTATFVGKIISSDDLSKPGTYEISVDGKINIHDVEKEWKSEGTIKVTSNGIAIKSDFIVNREDFGISGFYASMTDDVIKVFLVAVYK